MDDAAALRGQLLYAIDCLDLSPDFRRRTLEETADMNTDELRQLLAALKQALLEIRAARRVGRRPGAEYLRVVSNTRR
jgi:ribosomal protein L29